MYRVALADLQARGFKLACVTNKPREFTLDLLERVGLVEYFEVVISGDDTVEKKPHAAPVLAACERLEVSPAEAVMIGDSENDLLSARAAGCRAILVEGGYNEGVAVGSAAGRCYSRIAVGRRATHRRAGEPDSRHPMNHRDSRDSVSLGAWRKAWCRFWHAQGVWSWRR